MESIVSLGERAQHDAMAQEIQRRVLRNVDSGRARQLFSRMWGTVVLVRRREGAPTSTDANPTTQESSSLGGPVAGRSVPPIGPPELTLRFDFGRLMVHGGRVGRPDVTLWGTEAEILSLGELVPAWSQSGIASVLDGTFRRGRALSLAAFGPKARTGDGHVSTLEVFGRWNHPRFLYRLARVLDSSP